MKAEILCVGTELLHGDIVNTNAAFLSKKLAEIGIDVYYHTVVGDNPSRMRQAYEIAMDRADVVISTGGLGPTQDDITKEIVAEYFNLEMIYDEMSYRHLVQRYSKFHKEMPKNNLRQAYFPNGSLILKNKLGTANACIVEMSRENGKKKIVVLLPGPPFEMKPLVEEDVIPHLQKYSNQTVLGCKIIVMELGESKTEEMIMDLIQNQSNPTIATYAGKGQVTLRITAKASTEKECMDLIEPIKQEILLRFGTYAIVAEKDARLEDIVASLLIKKDIRLATAESCTGGLLASQLINYPGISQVYKEGFITYTDESKCTRLGVKRETLDRFGAVSEETAREMAKGVCDVSGADMGVSITGIAGPSGGSKEKPVGLVYVCIYHEGTYYDRMLNRDGDRQTIRERTVVFVLNEMKKILMSSAK